MKAFTRRKIYAIFGKTFLPTPLVIYVFRIAFDTSRNTLINHLVFLNPANSILFFSWKKFDNVRHFL